MKPSTYSTSTFPTKSTNRRVLRQRLRGVESLEQRTLMAVSIGDYVWNDVNANGIQDELPSDGVNGVEVKLYTSAGVQVGAPTLTANSPGGNPGYYAFNDLATGDYYVAFTRPTGKAFTAQSAGSNSDLDSNVDLFGKSSTFSIVAGASNLSIDAGLVPEARIGTFVWWDQNQDGLQVDTEGGIRGATVKLYKDGNLIKTTTTVAGGQYEFNGLPAGNYNLKFEYPVGYDRASPSNTPSLVPGRDDQDDSDGLAPDLFTATVTLVTGQYDDSVDQGFYKSVNASAVGNYVWRDNNGNGLQDEGPEFGVNGVTVTLYTPSASPRSTVTGNDTNGNPGYYQFANVPTGSSYLIFTPPGNQPFTIQQPIDDFIDQDIDSDADPLTGRADFFKNGPFDDFTIDAGLRPLIDLSLTASVSDMAPALNANVTYSVTVSNAAGFSPATGVTVNDVLPTGYTYVSDNASGSYNSATRTWTVGTVAPGTSRTIQVVATANSTGTKTNTAQVQTASPTDIDSTPGNAPGLHEDDDATINVTPIVPVKIGNYVWRDINTDGIQNEPASNGINGVTVTLYTAGGAQVGSPVITANDTSGNPGYYSFSNIAPGSYYIIVTAPADLTFTTQFAVGSTPATDSNVDSNGKSNPFTLLSGVDDLTIDAGLKSRQVCAMLDFNGNSSTSGTLGNIRTFSSGTISVNASGFSRDRTTGAWASAYLGSYGGGLGVTDSSEGSGANDTHTVDNMDGRDNYVLFEFNQAVVIDTAYLGYVVTDSDLQVWIGTVPNAFSSHQTLSDSLLAGFYTEYNWTTLTTARLADLNANNILGNVIVIAADASDTSPEDRFKIAQLNLCTPGNQQPASLGDFVWHDLNGNGIQDTGEPGIPGAAVTLTGGGADGVINGVGDTQVSTTTDSTGAYLFGGLVPGTQYRAAFAVQSGQIVNIDSKSSSGTSVTLGPGTYQVSWAGIAGGGLYDAWSYNNATSGNFRDSFSLTVDGVTTTYDRNDGNVAFNNYVSAAAAIADFNSIGSSLSFQTYTGASAVPQSIIQGPITFTTTKTSTFTFSVPDNFWADNGGGVSLRLAQAAFASPRKAGADAALDSNGPVSDIIILGSGEQNRTIDAGFYNEVKVGNLVWDDVNGDGIKGSTEVGIGGVVITLVGTTGSGSAISLSTTTASDGSYLFVGLPPGSYQAAVAASNFAVGGALNGYTASPTLVGTDRNVDSNTSPSATAPGALSSGASDLSVDFGYYIPKTKVCVNLYLEGNTATSGTAGNIISFASGSISAKASAFSRDSAGTWATAYLGRYGGGLGVTDTSEGTGANNTHTVDNIGRNNYILFEFSQGVTIDTAFLGYVVGDSDIKVWIGNASNAFNSHYTLSDAFLTGLGFSEVNYGDGSTRTADINAGNLTGNILVISANTGEASPNDQFKVAELSLCATVPTAQSTTKFFSVDDDTNKTFKYNSVGAFTQDFAVGSLDPRGITSNVSGSNVWIADSSGRIYNYTSAGVHVANWSSKVSGLQGVTTNGTHIWTVSDISDRVYYYPNGTTYANGSSMNPWSSFALNYYNNNPTDLTTDGTYIWVVNEGNIAGGIGDMVYKYTLSGTYLGRWQLDYANARPTGITIDPAGGNKLWIVDNSTDRIYEYSGASGCVSGGLIASKSYALAAGNTNPQGIADPPGPGDEAVTSESSLSVNEQYLNPDINPSFNSFNATDVNSDGVTSPLDALLVINRLNALRRGDTVDSEAWIYDDVSNDRTLSPIDVLLVINQLNSDRSGSSATALTATPLAETESIGSDQEAMNSFASADSGMGAGEGESIAARDAYFASYSQPVVSDLESDNSPARSSERSKSNFRRVSR